MKIVVLDAATLGFNPQAWELLADLGELTLHHRTPPDPSVIAQRCAGAAIVLTNKVPLSGEVLQRLPDLRMVSVLATGYNVVDTQSAARLGVTVCNVSGYSTDSVAQHTVALILELTNAVGLHHASVDAGDWLTSPDFCYWKKAPLDVAGLCVGIVGFGAIGRRTAEILHCLGAEILACSRSRRDQPQWPRFRWVDQDALFRESDIVSLHCPLTAENSGFVNASLLASMKRSALLVNTARGGLVNEADLATALRGGVIAGAALDVIASEPMRPDCPLRGLPNCILTPHIAWASEGSRRRLLQGTRDNIQGFLMGRPIHVVAEPAAARS